MLEKFLSKTKFDSYEDFMQNFKVNVPENFNFGYDVVDEWARTNPDKPALLWTNEQGEKIQFTFADIKRESDKAASFFTSLGIGRGDEHAAHLIHIRLHLGDGFIHRDGVDLDPEDIDLLRHVVTLP